MHQKISASFQRLAEKLSGQNQTASFLDKQIHFAVMLRFVKLGPKQSDLFEPPSDL